MADITFTHTLPDETYNHPEHPQLNGFNKRYLYLLGLWYSKELSDTGEYTFNSVQEFVDFIAQYPSAAIEKYAELMNKTLMDEIARGVRGFLKSINQENVEVDVTTTVGEK